MEIAGFIPINIPKTAISLILIAPLEVDELKVRRVDDEHLDNTTFEGPESSLQMAPSVLTLSQVFADSQQLENVKGLNKRLPEKLVNTLAIMIHCLLILARLH